ncbi:deoxynucleotide monophosphate kinase family protein [Streptomyces lavendulae]|uniref:deoxynucleotide monophosphate kinase family protein n=1 Tax=Streptomyces lavendulae TaxID=1914 RepID=UPI0036D1FB62
MAYKHVGLIGKARSGKDTVAKRLAQRWAYTRVAFADPLKEMALDLDPLIPTAPTVWVRLSMLVRDTGWEYAKDTYPEVRRVLQRAGQAVRRRDEGFWVDAAMDKVAAAEKWNLPVVITDVRYENEAQALLNRGFTLIRVVRPGAGLSDGNGTHESELALDTWATALTIGNVGTLDDLNATVDDLLLPRR